MARARTVAVLLLLSALALVACSDGDDPEPRAAPACAGGTLGPRSYVLCTAGDAPRQGLIVALHGRGSSAAEMQAMTGLEVPAAAAGYAVVYPDGLDGDWGDDTFPTPARSDGDEDVVFLDSLVAALHADPRI